MKSTLTLVVFTLCLVVPARAQDCDITLTRKSVERVVPWSERGYNVYYSYTAERRIESPSHDILFYSADTLMYAAKNISVNGGYPLCPYCDSSGPQAYDVEGGWYFQSPVTDVSFVFEETVFDSEDRPLGQRPLKVCGENNLNPDYIGRQSGPCDFSVLDLRVIRPGAPGPLVSITGQLRNDGGPIRSDLQYQVLDSLGLYKAGVLYYGSNGEIVKALDVRFRTFAGVLELASGGVISFAPWESSYGFIYAAPYGPVTPEEITGAKLLVYIANPFTNTHYGGAVGMMYRICDKREMPVAAEHAEIPETVALSQNYPNPFNPSTRIDYKLPEGGPVRLTIYDMQGREVTELVGGFRTAGRHTVRFDARALPSGAYVYRLVTPKEIRHAIMTLAK